MVEMVSVVPAQWCPPVRYQVQDIGTRRLGLHLVCIPLESPANQDQVPPPPEPVDVVRGGGPAEQCSFLDRHQGTAVFASRGVGSIQ